MRFGKHGERAPKSYCGDCLTQTDYPKRNMPLTEHGGLPRLFLNKRGAAGSTATENPHTFARTVLDALHGQYITLAKASHYLDGLKINDLHQLERYYAGV